MNDDDKKDKGVHIGRRVGHVVTDDGSVIGAIHEVHAADRCPNQKASGPVKVNSDAYRDGFERIFGGRATVGVA